jgi:hypothetical protein
MVVARKVASILCRYGGLLAPDEHKLILDKVTATFQRVNEAWHGG